MRYLNDEIFEDLMDRFKWYPKPFTVNIFCKDKESMTIFEKEIDANELNFNKIKSEKAIKYRGIHQEIKISLLNDNIYSCRGSRANAIIFDSSFPFNMVDNIFLTLATKEPFYGCVPFQKDTLEKDLKGIHVLPNYAIDLEEEE